MGSNNFEAVCQQDDGMEEHCDVNRTHSFKLVKYQRRKNPLYPAVFVITCLGLLLEYNQSLSGVLYKRLPL